MADKRRTFLIVGVVVLAVLVGAGLLLTHSMSRTARAPQTAPAPPPSSAAPSSSTIVTEVVPPARSTLSAAQMTDLMQVGMSQDYLYAKIGSPDHVSHGQSLYLPQQDLYYTRPDGVLHVHMGNSGTVESWSDSPK